MKFQANVGPESHSVAGLKVFVSYKTEDLAEATRLRDALVEVGFDVAFFVPVDSFAAKPEAEIREELRREILDSDYMCLVNSVAVTGSPWIAYEFVQAAQVLGRVIFVDTKGLGAQQIADALLESGARHSAKPGLQVEHTNVTVTGFEPEEVRTLIVEMLNSPRERWYDGRSSIPDPKDQLDLKSQSRLRKAARSQVLRDPRFANQAIVEVVPYDAHQIDGDLAEPTERRLTKLLLTEGRLPLLGEVEKRSLFVLHAHYRSEELSFLENGRFGVFVATERGFIGGESPEIRHGTYTDPRDGQEYRTITVDGRTWLAENLRFVSDEAWHYDDDPTHSKDWGCLYSWEEAFRAAPPGWHVASLREWRELAEVFGGYRSNTQDDAESVAKAEKSFQRLIRGGDSGLDIRLAGFRGYDKRYMYQQIDGYYWTSTGHWPGSAHLMIFSGGLEETQYGWAYNIAGHSVRCVEGDAVDWLPGE